MKRQLKLQQFALIEKYCECNDCYLAIDHIWPDLQLTHFSNFRPKSQDFFLDVVEVIDDIKRSKDAYIKEKPTKLVYQIFNQTRDLNCNAKEDEQLLYAKYVVACVMLILHSHNKNFYSVACSNALAGVLSDDLLSVKPLAESLDSYSQKLANWINEYMDSEQLLTEEIDTLLKGKNNKPSKSKVSEIEHGLDYPVFTRGRSVTNEHIIAFWYYLVSKNWISQQTSKNEFCRLFEGGANDCEIEWTEEVGKAVLYQLFQKIYDADLITTDSDKIKVGKVLEYHFIDKNKKFLTKVSNKKLQGSKYESDILEMMKILRHKTNSDELKRMLEEAMLSSYDRNDNQDMKWHKR